MIKNIHKSHMYNFEISIHGYTIFIVSKKYDIFVKTELDEELLYDSLSIRSFDTNKNSMNNRRSSLYIELNTTLLEPMTKEDVMIHCL